MNLNLKLFFWIALVLSINYTNAQTLDNNLILDLLNSNHNILHENLLSKGFEQKSESDIDESRLIGFEFFNDYSSSRSCCYCPETHYYSNLNNSIVFMITSCSECIDCKKDITIVLFNEAENQFLKWLRFIKAKDGIKQNPEVVGSDCFQKFKQQDDIYAIIEKDYDICFKTVIKNGQKRFVINAQKF
jgi:hypothetical protein